MINNIFKLVLHAILLQSMVLNLPFYFKVSVKTNVLTYTYLLCIMCIASHILVYLRLAVLRTWIQIRTHRIQMFLSFPQIQIHKSEVCTLFDFLSLKNDVNVLYIQKVKSRKKLGSSSISQKHGSADPDPHKNFMDPQHSRLVCKNAHIGHPSLQEV